jgi:hypothetical protein
MTSLSLQERMMIETRGLKLVMTLPSSGKYRICCTCDIQCNSQANLQKPPSNAARALPVAKLACELQ